MIFTVCPICLWGHPSHSGFARDGPGKADAANLTVGRGQWPAMLGAIRDYVNRGGAWWKTAGSSFCTAAHYQFNGRQKEIDSVGGLAYFGLTAGGGGVAQATDSMVVTDLGRPVFLTRL